MRDVYVTVGGIYGLPAAYSNTKVCNTDVSYAATIPGVDLIYPPSLDISLAYTVDDTYLNNTDSDDGLLDRRVLTSNGRIERRVRDLTTVEALKRKAV